MIERSRRVLEAAVNRIERISEQDEDDRDTGMAEGAVFHEDPSSATVSARQHVDSPAGWETVFRRITLPLIGPSLLAGAVRACSRALGEFGATITFAGNFPASPGLGLVGGSEVWVKIKATEVTVYPA